MVNEDILLSLKVDDETAIQNIVKLTQANNDLKKEIKDLNEQYKNDKSNAAYIAKVTQLNAQIKENTAGIRENSKEIKTNAAAIGAAEGSVNAARARVKDLTAAWESLSATAQKSDIGVKIQKELSTLNQSINASSISVSNFKDNIGNYSSANKNLSASLSMLASEMPNFAQSMRIGIMSLSNNWMGLSQSIKMVREEQAILKKQFDEGIISEKPIGTIKTIVNGILSWNTALMIGVTLLSVYGESIAKWVEGLFKAEKNVDSLRAQHLGLTDSFKTMSDSMKSSTNEYGTAISQINKMSVALEQAKGNHKEEQKAVDDYNSSLGVTFGKAKDVNEALSLISKNKDAYIQAMKEMSFSNAFFAKSSEDAVKIMEIQLKSNGEILGETANKFKERIQGWVDYVEGLKKDGAGKETLRKGLEGLKEATDSYNLAAKKERDAQISAITKHQNESEKLAEKHYNNMSNLYDKYNWGYDGKQKTANKRVIDNQLSMIQIYGQATQDQLDKLDKYISEMEDKAQKEQFKRLHGDVSSEFGTQTDTNTQDLQNASDTSKKRIELFKNELADIALLNEGSYGERKELLDQQMREELSNTNLTENQKLLIQKRYANEYKKIEKEKLNASLSAGAQLANAIADFAGEGTEIGKAAAATGITINAIQGGIAAVTKGVEQFGPIAGAIIGGTEATAIGVSALAAIKKVYAADGNSSTTTTTTTPTTATTGLNLPPLSGLYKTTADTTETSQKILETQPTPVVRVSEINEVQNTVKVKELSKI